VYSGFFSANSLPFIYGQTFVYSNGNTSVAATSGIRTSYIDSLTWAQSSGTAEFASFRFNGTINQTGTASGAVKGFYYNPTLTSVLGTHHAFHSTAGRVRFENLPTSATGLSSGDIWNDGGTLKIV
jgi:hypothetical protein